MNPSLFRTYIWIMAACSSYAQLGLKTVQLKGETLTGFAGWSPYSVGSYLHLRRGCGNYWHHGLSCRRSAGRQSRHHAANEIIARAFRRVGVPFFLGPHGLIRRDGKHPDGATLILWSCGRPLVWDFTCPDTLAPSHLQKTLVLALAAALEAEARKRNKYLSVLSTHSFAPVAMKTLGVWGADAEELLVELRWRLAQASQDTYRAKSFLRQLVDVAVQRGNALSIMGTFPIAGRRL